MPLNKETHPNNNFILPEILSLNFRPPDNHLFSILRQDNHIYEDIFFLHGLKFHAGFQ